MHMYINTQTVLTLLFESNKHSIEGQLNGSHLGAKSLLQNLHLRSQ